MSRWKRAGLSLASALLAELLVGIAMSVQGNRSLFLDRSVVFLWFASFLVLPGWLIALPLVLSINRTDGWRLWLLAILGTLIGPVLVGIIGLVITLNSPPTTTWNSGALDFAYVATAISVLTTAIYLISLKALSRQIT